jgi:hypothetical protein
MNKLSLVCLFTVLFCLSVSGQTSSPPEPRGVITGRVLLDNGQPAVGATVSAQLQGRPARSALTNAEGEFKLTGLTAAAYTLNAQLPAYVMTPLTTGLGEPQHFHSGDSATIQMFKGGVITGKVSSSADEPLPGLMVRAIRLRDAANRPASPASYRRRTDDRGVYRIFGLPPGAYVICTDGTAVDWSFEADDQVEDAPTYHPASTREAAIELTLDDDDELTNIDIRYRAERGRRVSGKVVGASVGFGINIYLKPAGGEALLASDWIQVLNRKVESGLDFSFQGVADGEYDLAAERRNGDDEGAFAPPQRVTVRGADVGGIVLRLTPFASLAGKFVLEAPPANQAPAKNACANPRAARLEEAVLHLVAETAQPHTGTLPTGYPSQQGEFSLRHLSARRYFVTTQLPSETWYLRALTRPDARPGQKVDLARTGLVLRAGEKLKDVTLTIGTNAASLSGQLKAAAGQPLPARLRVHLVPAEPTAADEALRFYEREATSNGTFAFQHLAPGKYWLLTRTLAAEESAMPLAWKAAERARLRREAEALNIKVELQPCQQVKDYILPHTTK